MVANSTIIPAFLAGWIQLLVPGDCFEEFFVKLNFLNVPCLKLTISKCLGYSIILGSSIVKLPQVLKIFSAKSGEGISLPSVTLELVAISSTWAYSIGNGYPFSTYGEVVFLAAQTSCIAVMVLIYSNNMMHAVLYTSAYVGIMGFLLSPAVPLEVLSFLNAANLVIVVLGKVIQIVTNIQNKGTGQLSAVTCLLLFLGSIARIFTSLQETGDSLVVLTYLLSSFTNGFIFAQIIYYWKKEPECEDTHVEGKKMK